MKYNTNTQTLEESPIAKKISLSADTKEIINKIISFRRDIHQNPELAFTEQRTAKIIAEQLKKLGYKVSTGIAKTGVVGLLEGKGLTKSDPTNGKSSHSKTTPKCKTVLVRADMDCLPVEEATGANYTSKKQGFMHACGHDGHVAILLGVAEIIASKRKELAGNVKLVFQPAEEGPGGAKVMIDEGVLTSPKVDVALGLHVWNNLPIGKVGIQPGPIMAIADEFELTIIGEGGHGAGPHQAIDPIVMAAQVITSLQTIVSRTVDPFETAVLSFGIIKGGQAFNIIPKQVELAGTVRTYNTNIRNKIYKKMEEIIKGVTKGFGGSYKLNYKFGYPATVNNHEITELVRETAISVLGSKDSVVPTKSMGGEDMSYFLEKVPGCYFFLGSANPALKLNAPHHSPYFDFDEAALPIGTEILVRSVEKLLNS